MRAISICLAATLGLFSCANLQAKAREGTMRVRAELAPPGRFSDAWVRWHSCVRDMKRSAFSWRDYRNLLAELDNDRYLVVPLRSLAAAKKANPQKVVVGMRHDVDGNLCKAAEMARLERQAGFASTYFVRHTEKYYAAGWPAPQRRTTTLGRFRELQALGHEVGLHFDVVTLAIQYGLDANAVMHTEAAYLRSAGIDLVGVSHHGSELARTLEFNNFEWFAGMTERDSIAWGERRVALGERSLAEYGLEYEAYHLPYEHYISDSGGRWNVPLYRTLRAIEPGEAAVILTHPVWWGAEDEPLKYL